MSSAEPIPETPPEVSRIVMAWHQRIKAEREKRGLSIRGAAREIGIHSGSLHKYESGDTCPSYHVGRDIDRFYGIGCDRCEGVS